MCFCHNWEGLLFQVVDHFTCWHCLQVMVMLICVAIIINAIQYLLLIVL